MSKSTAMTIRETLRENENLKLEIEKNLEGYMTPERMTRIALTAVDKNKSLQECKPTSLFRALIDLASNKLEPDGEMAALVPYGKECKVIVMYQGYVQLAFRSGFVESIHADVIYENDYVEYSLGEVREHVPWVLRNEPLEGSRGRAIGAYCIVKFKEGGRKCEFMSCEEINSVRDRSRAGKSGPWVTDWSEMAKKTVFRRCRKWLPKSAEFVGQVPVDFDELPDIREVHTGGVTAVKKDLLQLEDSDEQQEEG